MFCCCYSVRLNVSDLKRSAAVSESQYLLIVKKQNATLRGSELKQPLHRRLFVCLSVCVVTCDPVWFGEFASPPPRLLLNTLLSTPSLFGRCVLYRYTPRLCQFDGPVRLRGEI